MAELAGLVVGGIALASLFDTCMTTFDRLEAGKNCGKDYQEAALKITLLGNRLRRWEELYRASALSSTASDGHLAEAALKSVKASLDKVCKTGERYQTGAGVNDIAAVTDKVQAMTMAKVKTKAKISLGSKFIWALHDKTRVQDVIQSIRFNIEELESLSKSLVPAYKQEDLEKEAGEVLRSAYLEEPDTSVPILKASAHEVDPQFRDAVLKVTGHHFGKIVTTDRARTHQGNIIAHGYTGGFATSQHSFDNIRTEGDARSHQGDMYGGKSVFDD